MLLNISPHNGVGDRHTRICDPQRCHLWHQALFLKLAMTLGELEVNK